MNRIVFVCFFTVRVIEYNTLFCLINMSFKYQCTLYYCFIVLLFMLCMKMCVFLYIRDSVLIAIVAIGNVTSNILFIQLSDKVYNA